MKKIKYDYVGNAYLIELEEVNLFEELQNGLENGDHDQEQKFIETFSSSIYFVNEEEPYTF